MLLLRGFDHEVLKSSCDVAPNLHARPLRRKSGLIKVVRLRTGSTMSGNECMVPLVDMADCDVAVAAWHDAMRKAGFAVVVNHGVPAEVARIRASDRD